MSALQQMGYASANLLGELHLGAFRGAVLSPVDYGVADVREQILNHSQHMEMIFDSQIYFPSSDRPKFAEWNYFPKDVDSADTGNDAWWEGLVRELCKVYNALGPTSALSPLKFPKIFHSDYYSQAVRIGAMHSNALKGSKTQSIQMAVVGLADLSSLPDRADEVASILSRCDSDRIFLIFYSDRNPRNELVDVDELASGMKLIHLLKTAGLEVIVGFCAAEMVLWKYAGAKSCTTGKFFNLRRFTTSRFDLPSGGGGQLPYWFEESLLSFVRESDFIRLNALGLIGKESQRNPFYPRISFNLQSSSPRPWLGESWRQYLSQFADLEQRISDGTTQPKLLLQSAEEKWLNLEGKVLMEEVRNNGQWLRNWRRAVLDFDRRIETK